MGCIYGPLALVIWLAVSAYADYIVTLYYRYDRYRHSGYTEPLINQRLFSMPWWDMAGWIIIGAIVFIVFLVLGFADPVIPLVLLVFGIIFIGAITFADFRSLQRLHQSSFDALPERYRSPTYIIDLPLLPASHDQIPGNMPFLYIKNGSAAGKKFYLSGNSATIGRSKINSLLIKDSTISRQHARLVQHQGQWYIQDLQSRSGIYVNGTWTQAQALHHCDLVRLGDVEFEFHLQ